MKTSTIIFLCAIGLFFSCHHKDETPPDVTKTGEKIDFQHPKVGQMNCYAGFRTLDYYNFDSKEWEFTGDTLVVEVIAQNAFGFQIMEYFTPNSAIFADPIQNADTAFYSFRTSNDALEFDWDLSFPYSPRGRLFDFGLKYPFSTGSLEFEKNGWKVFPEPGTNGFGQTGTVAAYKPLDTDYGQCNVLYGLGSQFSHNERLMFIYLPDRGMVTRYAEYMPGGFAAGFVLL